MELLSVLCLIILLDIAFLKVKLYDVNIVLISANKIEKSEKSFFF